MGEMCKHVQMWLQKTATVIAIPAIHQDNAWLMKRSVWTAARTITSEKFAEAEEIQLSITQNRNQTKAM